MRGHAGSATSQYDNNKKITKDGLRNVLKLFAATENPSVAPLPGFPPNTLSDLQAFQVIVTTIYDDILRSTVTASAQAALCILPPLAKWGVDKGFKYGDDGIDFAHSRKTYQVKARDANVYKEPDLLCRINYAKADRFILAEVNSEKHKVRFVGWCTRDEMMESTIDIPGKGTRYIRYRQDCIFAGK